MPSIFPLPSFTSLHISVSSTTVSVTKILTLLSVTLPTKKLTTSTQKTHMYTHIYMATLIRRALDPERIRQPTSQLITFSMQPINPSTTQPIDASMKVSLSQCTLTHRFVPSTHTHICVKIYITEHVPAHKQLIIVRYTLDYTYCVHIHMPSMFPLLDTTQHIRCSS